MELFEIVVIGIGLAMDAFAVSVCKGLSMKKLDWKKIIIVALYFGIFQGLMPVFGYLLGSAFSTFVQKVDHWIAFILLAIIGANNSVIKFEEIRTIREVRNDLNRKVNCETANINKTVKASVDQIEDIEFIKKMKKYGELTDEQKEIAKLRIEFPDATLKELGLKLDNPIGKSGVNHRLQKIHEFAEELRKLSK